MRFVDIPRTELRVSAICLGSALLGTAVSPAESFELLDTYVESGGTTVDTASVYANWLTQERSVSEKTIGRWLARRGVRDRIVLSTKGAHPELTSMHCSRLSRVEIRADLEASLRNLRTDHIDLYWLHRDDETLTVAELLGVLKDQVALGDIRYYGCSNWRLSRIREAQIHAESHGLHGFCANQPLWSLAHVDAATMSDQSMVAMDAAMRAYHTEAGLAALAYSSQARGLFQKAARAGGWAKLEMPAHYCSSENEARLLRATQVAAESGLTMTQIVLGYLLSQPFPTIPIVGCRTVEQLADTLQAGGVLLTSKQMRFLETGE